MKTRLLYLISVVALIGCNKEECVSCIAQGEKSGIIIDHDIICDKSTLFVDGFIDGFKSRFTDRGDTAVVICERFTYK